MLGFGVAIVLAVISVATFPCWSYSRRWGHGPSALGGTLLVCVAIIAIGGKSAPKAAEPEIGAVIAPPAAGVHSAFHRHVVTVSIEPELAAQ